MNTAPQPEIMAPPVYPDYRGHTVSILIGIERFDYATWYPEPGASGEPGTLIVRRWEGSTSYFDQSITERAQYNRIAGIRELSDMGLEPLVHATGIRTEQLAVAEPKSHEILSMRIPPIEAFCNGANQFNAALPVSFGQRMHYEIFDGDAFDGIYQLGKLKEGIMPMATGSLRVHDMLEHGVAALALSSDLVGALGEGAGHWLNAQPTDDMSEEQIVRNRDDYLQFIEVYLRTGAITQLLQGDFGMMLVWVRYIPGMTIEKMTGYVENARQQITDIGALKTNASATAGHGLEAMTPSQRLSSSATIGEVAIAITNALQDLPDAEIHAIMAQLTRTRAGFALTATGSSALEAIASELCDVPRQRLAAALAAIAIARQNLTGYLKSIGARVS